MKNRLPSILIALFIALPFTACNLTQDPLNNPQQKHLPDSMKRVFDIKFSPDGTCLAVASNINVLLYNTQTYDKPDLLEGHTGRIWSIAFRSDGKVLASAGDGTVRLWDVSSRQQIRTFRIDLHPAANIALSPDGKMIASGGGQDAEADDAHLWDADTGKRLHTFPGHPNNLVHDVAFSPDGKILASCDETIVRLWDVNTGQQIRILTKHPNMVLSVSFSPDGKTLASGSVADNFVRLWDVNTGQQINTLSINDEEWLFRAWDVVFSPDGDTVASAGSDVHLWQLSDADLNHHHRRLRNGRYPHYPISDVSFSPDGNTIACSGFREAHVWDVKTGELIRVLISEH